MIDLTPEDLALVQKILRDGLPEAARVWVFGSRAKGTTKRASDLDLAIDAGSPLPFSVTARLNGVFDETPLAFSVDLADLHAVSPEFRTLIDAHKIPLPGFET